MPIVAVRLGACLGCDSCSLVLAAAWVGFGGDVCLGRPADSTGKETSRVKASKDWGETWRVASTC